jgi:hypothetical protein
MLKVEGLFRQSGKNTEVQDVKRSYDAGIITLALFLPPLSLLPHLLPLFLYNNCHRKIYYTI